MNLKHLLWLVLWPVFFSACTSDAVNQDYMVSLKKVASISEIKLSDLNIAIRRNRNNASLYARRAVLLQERGKIAPALKDIEFAIDLDGDKGEYYFRKALILRQAKNFKSAQSAAADAEKLGYKGYEIYILQTELLIRLKKFSEAIEKVNIALTSIPTHEYALYYRGVARAELFDTASAIINFRRAIQSSPDFIYPYLQLASMYNGKKDHARAFYYLQRAEKIDSLNGYLWYQKGLGYTGLRRPDSAQYSLNKAIRLDPGLYKAHYELGLISYKKQNFKQVVHHLEKVKLVTDTLPKLEEILAESYEKSGRFRLALQQYTKVLRKKPNDVRAQWGVRRTNWALYKIKRDSLRRLEDPFYYADTIQNTY